MLCLCGKPRGPLSDSKPWSRDKDGGGEKETRIAVLGAPGVGKTGQYACRHTTSGGHPQQIQITHMGVLKFVYFTANW